MARPMPAYVNAADIIDQPLQHRWSSDIGLEFYAARDPNMKLHSAVDRCNHKMEMALGVAIAEFSFWRFSSFIDTSDGSNRIEAAWASAIVPEYSKSLQTELKASSEFEKPNVEGPVQLIIHFLGLIRAHYATGSIYLAEPIVKLALLARYVIPNPATFDEWLSGSIARGVKAFPRTTEYNIQTKKYDSSGEAPVPREFFEPGFIYTSETGKLALQKFLKMLDYKKNPYLRSPEEMKEKGFQGTPYVL